MSDFPSHPASKFVNVTPSDTALLEYDGEVKACRGISVEVLGDIAVKDDVGNTVILAGLAAAVIHPVSTSQILSTGTAATGISAYF